MSTDSRRGGLRVPVLALATVLAGCASAPQRPVEVPPAPPVAEVAPQPAPDPVRMQVVFTAMQMVGIPYLWGGATPAGFDCSGLVQYTFGHAGLRLPRTAAGQLAATRPVSLEQAAPGDLLFFQDGGRTSHVAIYLGEGRFVHAPSGGQRVSLDSFGSEYWRTRFRQAGRVIPAS